METPKATGSQAKPANLTSPINLQFANEMELLQSTKVAQERLEAIRRKKEQDVIQAAVDTLTGLLPGTNLPNTDSSLAQLKLLCTVVGDQVQSLEEVAEANAKKEHQKALNIALVKKLNELRSDMQKAQKDITNALDEGNLPLSKIFQPHLLCDDVLVQKQKQQTELQLYVSTFKPPYDSFTAYGQTVHRFHIQSAKIELEINNRTRYLQELQLVLLPCLQILQKCYLNLDALMVT